MMKAFEWATSRHYCFKGTREYAFNCGNIFPFSKIGCDNYSELRAHFHHIKISNNRHKMEEKERDS